jgi:hypothetical protein
MHCPNCGQKTSPELKFCRACGMKLDSVARALSSHLEGEEPETAPGMGGEKKSAGLQNKRVYSLIYIGLAMSFLGPAIAVLGQGVWGAKSAGILIALLGMFSVAIGALPVAARFDRALLRSLGGKEKTPGAGPELIKKSEPVLNLTPADDFEPVASVTESTTRDLDKNKTKVLR